MSYLKLKDMVFFLVWAAVSSFIFYSQIYKGYPSDLVLHLSSYQEFIEEKVHPYPGFYIVVFLLNIIGLTIQNAAIVALTCFTLSICLIIYFIISKHLKISDNEKLLLTGSLMLISAIYLPFFNNIYVGQGVSNVWHNPTLLALKPFAYLSFIVFMKISLNKENNFKIYIVFTILLILSLLFKPNFIIFFVPSVLIYLLIYHRKDLKLWVNLFMTSILLGVFLLGQYLLTYNSSAPDGIAIDPFVVWNEHSPNWFISFLLSIAFPLFLIIFNAKKTIHNRYITLSWICVIVSFAQYALLIETGERAMHGNWGWGIQASIPLLFLFSTIEWFRWIKTDGDKRKKIIVNTVFALHLVSGIYYLMKILLGYSYV